MAKIVQMLELLGRAYNFRDFGNVKKVSKKWSFFIDPRFLSEEQFSEIRHPRDAQFMGNLENAQIVQLRKRTSGPFFENVIRDEQR